MKKRLPPRPNLEPRKKHAKSHEASSPLEVTIRSLQQIAIERGHQEIAEMLNA